MADDGGGGERYGGLANKVMMVTWGPYKMDECHLKRNHLKRNINYIFQPSIFRGHVSFQGNGTLRMNPQPGACVVGRVENLLICPKNTPWNSMERYWNVLVMITGGSERVIMQTPVRQYTYSILYMIDIP